MKEISELREQTRSTKAAEESRRPMNPPSTANKARSSSFNDVWTSWKLAELASCQAKPSDSLEEQFKQARAALRDTTTAPFRSSIADNPRVSPASITNRAPLSARALEAPTNPSSAYNFLQSWNETPFNDVKVSTSFLLPSLSDSWVYRHNYSFP